MLFSNILKDETFVPGARLALSLSLPWKSCGELTHPKIACASLCFVVFRCVTTCCTVLPGPTLSLEDTEARKLVWMMRVVVCAPDAGRSYKSAREALFGITTALTIQWVVFFANSKHIKMNKFLVSDPLTNINN